jgi:hypothetical protein
MNKAIFNETIEKIAGTKLLSTELNNYHFEKKPNNQDLILKLLKQLHEAKEDRRRASFNEMVALYEAEYEMFKLEDDKDNMQHTLVSKWEYHNYKREGFNTRLSSKQELLEISISRLESDIKENKKAPHVIEKYKQQLELDIQDLKEITRD